MTGQNKPSTIFWNGWVAGAILFFIALFVRYIGLKFGFPLFTHPDEGYLVNPIRWMSLYRTLDPGTYSYPAFASYYTNSLLFRMLSTLKFGVNYEFFYWKDPFFFYTAARLMTAIQGSLMPVIAWLIGRRLNNPVFAWSAAILFVFYSPFVLHSHYITVDIPLTLLMMLVLLCCLEYLNEKRLAWLLVAALLVAISAMEKYPGILSYGMVMVTIGIGAFTKDKLGNTLGWRYFIKMIGMTLIIVALGVLIFGFPFVKNFDFAWKQIMVETRSSHLGSDGLGWGGNLLYYLRTFYANAGLMVCLLGIVGIAATILQKDPAYLLLFFGSGYWIALSKLALHHARWSLPMMITPLLLAGLGISFLWRLSAKVKITRVILSIALIGLFGVYALQGVLTSVMLTWPDTRNEALHFMLENGITEDKSISEGYTPYFPNSKAFIFEYDLQNPDDKEFMVLSSLMGDRYAAEPVRYASENAYYANVRSRLTLVKEFVPTPDPDHPIDQLRAILEYVRRQLGGTESPFSTGPKLEIYRLPDG